MQNDQKTPLQSPEKKCMADSHAVEPPAPAAQSPNQSYESAVPAPAAPPVLDYSPIHSHTASERHLLSHAPVRAQRAPPADIIAAFGHDTYLRMHYAHIRRMLLTETNPTVCAYLHSLLEGEEQ